MAARQAKMASVPHLINLNEDPALSGVILHFIEADMVMVGSAGSRHDTELIYLAGLSIRKRHAIVVKSADQVCQRTIQPPIHARVTMQDSLSCEHGL